MRGGRTIGAVAPTSLTNREGYTMEIIRRIVDLDGNVVARDPLNVRVSSRDEAEKYIQNHVAKVFSLHGYNEEHGYWWGRQDDDNQVSRFTVEL